MLGEHQCLDGVLNSYLDKCLGIIRSFDEFDIRHIMRTENHRANDLAQKASGYCVNRGRFHVAKKPMLEGLGAGQSTPDCPTDAAGLFGTPDCPMPIVGLSDGDRGVLILPIDDSAEVLANEADWRTPIAAYLHNPSVRTDRKIWRVAFKYTLVNELYRRTSSGVLLKCLGLDDSTLSMAEVHEGICGTHQSALK